MLARKRLALVVASAAVVLAAPDGVRGEERPDFTGTWRVNASLSQPWRDKFELAFGARPTQTVDTERQAVWDRLLRVLNASEEINVEQTSSEIKFASEENVRIFYFDRPHTRQTPEAVKIKARSRWNGDQLVIEESTGDITLVEVLSPRSGGEQIHYLATLSGKELREPFTLSRIYDRVAP
jgi:hypothetical protein